MQANEIKEVKITNQAEYDAAKEALQLERKLPSGNTTYIIALERDLFKYRRANNIFEVGDWVVVGEHQVLAQFVGYAHKGTPAELPQIDIDGRLYNSNFLAWKHTIPPCKDILSRNLSDNPKLQKLVTDYRNTDHGAEFDNFGLFDLPKSVVQSLGEIT